LVSGVSFLDTQGQTTSNPRGVLGEPRCKEMHGSLTPPEGVFEKIKKRTGSVQLRQGLTSKVQWPGWVQMKTD